MRWVGNRWVQIPLAVLLLVALVYFLDAQRLLALWTATPWWRLGAVLLMAMVGLAIQWTKWGGLVRAFAPGISSRQIGRSIFAGFALGLFSPGRLGELGRGVFLPGDRASYTALAVGDRLLSFGITACLGGLGGWLSGALPGVVLLLLLIAAGSLTFMLGRWAWPYFEKRLAPLRVCRSLGSRPWLRAGFFSFLFNLTFIAQFILLARGWGELPFAAWGGVPLIYTLKALLPLSFLELGVREGAAVWVFARLGLDPAVAFSAALGVFGFNVLLPGAVGLFVGTPKAGSAE